MTATNLALLAAVVLLALAAIGWIIFSRHRKMNRLTSVVQDRVDPAVDVQGGSLFDTPQRSRSSEGAGVPPELFDPPTKRVRHQHDLIWEAQRRAAEREYEDQRKRNLARLRQEESAIAFGWEGSDFIHDTDGWISTPPVESGRCAPAAEAPVERVSEPYVAPASDSVPCSAPDPSPSSSGGDSGSSGGGGGGGGE